jgi:hypothetical protein
MLGHSALGVNGDTLGIQTTGQIRGCRHQNGLAQGLWILKHGDGMPIDNTKGAFGNGLQLFPSHNGPQMIPQMQGPRGLNS